MFSEMPLTSCWLLVSGWTAWVTTETSVPTAGFLEGFPKKGTFQMLDTPTPEASFMEASLPPYESDGGCLARAHQISCMFANITPQASQYHTHQQHTDREL